MDTLKIATFNVNGIQTRLATLLAWLEQEVPDIVCLQELKTPDTRFLTAVLERARYGVIWQDQLTWNGITILVRNSRPLGVRRSLPGNTNDPRSHYLEAAVDGLLMASLYLPNGNPQPGPESDYKLAWSEYLIRYVTELTESGHSVVLAGGFNVIPGDFDIYDTRSWKEDALLQPESRECLERLLWQGWVDTPCRRFPNRRTHTPWNYFHQYWQYGAGLRVDRLPLSASLADHLEDTGVDCRARGEEYTSDHVPAWISLRLN